VRAADPVAGGDGGVRHPILLRAAERDAARVPLEDDLRVPLRGDEPAQLMAGQSAIMPS
jgi:hypothetical protein